MHPIVKALIKQIPPPQPGVAIHPDRWGEVEAALGLALPDDYKDIVTIYGDYSWADFLYLLNPFTESRYLNLLDRQVELLDAERQLRAAYPEQYPLPLYPEAGGLLPFCITDNGDMGFWITHYAAEKWPILLKEARSPDFEVHFLSTALFLYQFSGGRFQTLVFPDLFSSE